MTSAPATDLPTVTLTVEIDLPGESDLTRVTAVRSFDLDLEAVKAAQQTLDAFTHALTKSKGRRQ